ncbi:MAG: HlyD family type I secretion periplasmic adaptor subunit [Mesorhizobium sp.]|uniref:HlyD family type I secretion periplasmic adaptor subunit n=2 Tax=Mesorhizobium TaxID=68287 RepID=UPI000F74CDD2|nr:MULTISPECIES: HlyD family type I secretion periplasmic adaptor subunit [unclassified Mesorhizobium]AZO48426.1 HlyD family type I secretion periplasmic adaptor subunit [Mesorhizobium sp. M4B.F.Ca.ET.058.02.1.1]RUX49924.1 HlyD family type I secretion periplasmic adaptor subunit [Mesorhizobium sp. M4A.F.Ca.ET.050.02.1.1]RVD41593.1 HlyD family type I secretion periplasmic adaptor subunit [Mesorhizobium sp. M4A.F.Ca.ET.020.02.1.1]RWC09973.1 MAG: HlyD family type I secretion periplasmic adaptor su
MKSASQNIVEFPRVNPRRHEHEVAFLPAALEITESPPSPIGRAIGASIIAVFCFALVWASLGSVDIVATATGKIVPDGRTKLIQPFDTGVVRAINVRDGQSVKAGDVLIELDPTMTDADQERQKSDLLSAELDVARLRAALAEDPLAAFRPPQGASAAEIEMHRQFLVSQLAEQNTKLAEIDREQTQKEAERSTTLASGAKLEATIPLLQERVDIQKNLVDKALASKVVYLSEYQELVGLQQDLNLQQSRLREADAAIALLKETREKTAAEYRRATYEALAKAEQRAASTGQEVIKAERRTKLQQLTAPVDGVVQQLAVHTVGGVVTPAQPLAVVVPSESHLEIEAMLSNRDIGFVHPGQKAEIKVDTFNFTRYGLLHGEVLSVSSDAIVRDRQQSASNDRALGAAQSDSEPRDQELQYATRVSLDRTDMQVDDKLVKLGPGMAVTVEIKTGTRSIIGYFLSPLAKTKQESLHER